MINYDVRCAEGHRAEVQLPSMFSENPPCAECGQPTSRVPAMGRMVGRASAGPSRDDMPMTWHGIGKGDPEKVNHWHQQMTKRERLEEKYPELAGDRRPVLAHEGIFADKPLRAGDPEVAQVAKAAFGAKKDPPAAQSGAASTPGGKQ